MGSFVVWSVGGLGGSLVRPFKMGCGVFGQARLGGVGGSLVRPDKVGLVGLWSGQIRWGGWVFGQVR